LAKIEKKKHWIDSGSQTFTINKEKNGLLANGLPIHCATQEDSLQCHLRKKETPKPKNKIKKSQVNQDSFFDTIIHADTLSTY